MSPATPTLYIVVGPNGTGKFNIFYRVILLMRSHNTDPPTAARCSSSPFVLPAQPICGTVRTSNESGNKDARRRGADSSSSSFKRIGDHYCRSALQQCHGLLARHGGEVA